MGLIVSVLFLGLLASLSPSTIVVFILLLATTRAPANAAAFLVGWCVSLVIVFTASYALGGAEANQHGSGRIAVDVIEILLGLALFAAAVRQWRRRDIPRTGSEVTRRLTEHLEQLNPWQAAIVGVLEQPWTLTAALAVVLDSSPCSSDHRLGRLSRLHGGLDRDGRVHLPVLRPTTGRSPISAGRARGIAS